jgi:hypothetical protein
MSGARPRFRMAPRAAQLDSSAEIVGETPEASPVYTRKVFHQSLTVKRHNACVADPDPYCDCAVTVPIFMGLPDQLVRGSDPDPSIIKRK